MTMHEMRAFIGVILQMRLVQLSDIKDYWSTHTTLNFPLFRSIFSRDRFLQIFWMLHVGDSSSTTIQGKIQPFLDRIIPLFQQCLTPRHQISIDEAMIAFRGRIFRQCISGKPEPWGIKAYVFPRVQQFTCITSLFTMARRHSWSLLTTIIQLTLYLAW